VASKREARIERQNAKSLADQKESDKLRKSVELPPRTPRAGVDPGSIFDMVMTWTDAQADRADSWTWGQPREWGQEAWDGVIHPKLMEWEKLLWREIDAMNTGGKGRHKAHHSMPCDVLCDESQLRLMDLGHSGESIFRFRLGNMRRLWGFRIVNEFQILWYDPLHHIYPTDPD
jgi:hypothetical protein